MKNSDDSNDNSAFKAEFAQVTSRMRGNRQRLLNEYITVGGGAPVVWFEDKDRPKTVEEENKLKSLSSFAPYHAQKRPRIAQEIVQGADMESETDVGNARTGGRKKNRRDAGGGGSGGSGRPGSKRKGRRRRNIEESNGQDL